VLLVFLTGVARVKVSANIDVCPSVTLRGQNYNFSHSPRENLFNSIPDNDARMLALCKLRSAEKRMTEATYKPTLRPETSLSDLERALSGDFVSVQDMALSCRLDLTPLNNNFWFYWRKRVRPGLWSRFKKTIETNDLVTELERIKAK
jgi:hypothetical protein